MKKTIIFSFLATFLMMSAFPVIDYGQEYEAPPVEISKEKVRYKDNIYYSHVVKEKQTLYSICKAYHVTQQEIFDANPTLHLETEGLKKNQILLIPVKPEAGQSEQPAQEPAESRSINETKPSEPEVAQDKAQPSQDEYFFHRVKWYEDLGSIARKYNVSEQSIMNINGMTNRKVKRRQMLKIPNDWKKWDSGDVASTAESEQAIEPSEPVESEDEENDEGSLTEFLVSTGRHDVHAAILMPFNAVRSTDRQLVLDFYSGALLAARDLGKQGIDIELSVYDFARGSIPDIFDSNDFILGPITRTEISRAATASDGRSWIISPADRTVEMLADSMRNIIQAPTSTNYQIIDAVNWLKSDVRSQDKVILISHRGTAGSQESILEKAMEESGIHYSLISVNVLEAGQLNGRLSSYLSGEGTTRVIAASESESFMNQVVKSLYILAMSGKDIVLYSNARIRTFETIETKQLHGVKLHASVATEVDYGSKEVQDFTIAYRSVYNAEPSHFSFQGYDLMRQFSMLVSRYGKRWPRAIDNVRMNGLQSDFDYIHNPSGSYSNIATRRVVYSPDYSIMVVR